MSEGKKEGYSGVPDNENLSMRENPDSEEYRFVREVIKEKPLDKRKLLINAAVILISAILFGVISAFTFAKVLPIFTKGEKVPTEGTNVSDSDLTEDSAKNGTSGSDSDDDISKNNRDYSEDGNSAADTQDEENSGNGLKNTDGAVSDGAGESSENTENAEKTNTGSASESTEDGMNNTGHNGNGKSEEEGIDGKNQESDSVGNSGNTEMEEVPEFVLTQDDFDKYFEGISQAVTEMEKQLVTVRGITSDVDWMNNSYEDEKQISGLLVANNGKEYFVLTEYRVVDQVDRILVIFADGSSVDAHFQKQDPGTGLTILKISASDISAETKKAIEVADFDNSVSVKRGQQVIALGSPAGYSGAMASGMITSVSNIKGSLDNEFHVLTTDIAGDSGGSGVLMDLNGNIAGIILQNFSIENNKNMVTALPVRELKELVELLVENKELIYLGIHGQDIDGELMNKTGIPKGVFVNAVEDNSPAMASGLQNGDVIVRIGETTIDTQEKLRRQLNKYKSEQKISITAMRKGAEGYVEIVFDVTLGAL